jgi:hypothetical protein
MIDEFKANITKYLVLTNLLVSINVLQNKTIPYTFPLRYYRGFGQSVFHYIFKETFRKKKSKKI